MVFEPSSEGAALRISVASGAEAKKKYESGEMKAEEYVRTLRPEDLKDEYVIKSEESPKGKVLGEVKPAEKNKSPEKPAKEPEKPREAEKVEKEEGQEKVAEKSELEVLGDKLKKLEKAISCMQGTLEHFKSKEKSPKNDEMIASLEGEISKAQADREKTEMQYRIANLEKRVSDLEKIIRNGKTEELGLTEDEAKQAVSEMKGENEVKKMEAKNVPEKTEVVIGEKKEALPSAKPEKDEGVRLNELLPSEVSGLFKKAYEKYKKEKEGKSKWGWLKERLRNFITLGGRDIKQFKNFWDALKKNSEDIVKDARKIQQEKMMDLDTAMEEALKMKLAAEKEGKFDFGELTSEELEKYSSAISEERRDANGRLITKIINQATENLERKLKENKDVWGDSVVSIEKLDDFRKRLRQELEALQSGYVFREEIENAGELGRSRPSRVREAILANPKQFGRTIKENLDPEYWKKLVFSIPKNFFGGEK